MSDNEKLVPMIRAVCYTCGWNARFPGKSDAALFVSDFHAEDRGVGHPFEGTITEYNETREYAIYRPRTPKK